MFDLIKDNADTILTLVTSVVTVASIIANFTKTNVDNVVVEKIAKFINLLALNIKSPNVKKIDVK